MLRELRALRGIVADLEKRAGARAALGHARALLAFYVEQARRADHLIGADGEVERPRRRLRRWRWKKDTTRDLVLRALSDGREMTAPELRHCFELEGECRSRQGVSFVLLQLEREKKVERVTGGRLDRWRVVQPSRDDSEATQ